MKLERLPDPWLDRDSVLHANQMFYAGEPHEYFSHRLALLVLAAGKPELVEETICEGISYEDLHVGGRTDGPREPRDEEKEAHQHRQFVITETLALLHHVSETLLRYYLAHEHLPESPWIELASEPPVDAFKRKVKTRFDGQKVGRNKRKALARVFYGSERPIKGLVPDDVWDASLENLEAWLTHFAARFLGDAQVYNSVKHGLAIQPGEPSVQLMTPPDEAEGRDPPLIHAHGPGVSYLEKRGEDERWHISTKWLSPYSLAHLMGEIQFACLLLRGIWQVGRARYLDEAQELRIFRKPTLDEYKATLGEGIITNFMSINMLYVYAYPPDLVCTDCDRKPRARERARLSWRMYRDAEGAPRVVCSDCAKHIEAA